MSSPRGMDERAAFYLEHEAQILEWARLGDLVTEEAERFMRGLQTPLTQLAQSLGVDLWVRLPEEGEQMMALVRPQWRRPEDPLARCGVGVGFASGRHFHGFYTGAFVNVHDPRGASLSRAARDAIKVAGVAEELQSEAGWIAWRWETPGPRFWEDLAPFAGAIVAAVATHWQTFGPLLDQAVASL